LVGVQVLQRTTQVHNEDHSQSHSLLSCFMEIEDKYKDHMDVDDLE